MSSYFPRVSLAEEMVDATTGFFDFSDASPGLFIAAPRRTGKTTFIAGWYTAVHGPPHSVPGFIV